MPGKLRVLLADDHNVVRAGLRALIDAQPDMEVVAEAADGESACTLAAETGPDVVVMDVSMPGLGGARATEQIRRDLPAVKVLALTVHEDRGYLQQFLRAGASGYLLKRAAAAELIHALHAVAHGGSYIDPNLAGRVLGGLMGNSPRPGAAPLSEREDEVLRLIARGFTNREIAADLVVSEATVKSHVNHLFAKAGVRDRAQAVAYAFRHGLAEGG
jgi:DNA-binding NarL/FixJ family response regulator